eukprot:12260212-Alexandrium_andersonii.AAC.1
MAEGDRELEHSYMDEGARWLLAATDGSGLDSDHPMLMRAGAGVFFATSHSQNWSEAVRGAQQSAQSGEV